MALERPNPFGLHTYVRNGSVDRHTHPYLVNHSSLVYDLLMSLLAKQVTFRYAGGPVVLDQVSCEIPSGSITAIVGPNGGGKSTLIRLLAGLRTPASGSITLDDQPLVSIAPRERAKRMAFIEQRPDLAFDFTVRRVVGFGLHAIGNDQDRIDNALERFELSDRADTPYGHLSVGQQQRVSMARAWVQIGSTATTQSGYLLADEPCSAMDPKHTLQSMIALRELADRGIGIAVVIHDLSTAARWADRAIVLDQHGSLVAQGTPDEAMSESVLSGVFEVAIRKHTLADGQCVFIPTKE